MREDTPTPYEVRTDDAAAGPNDLRYGMVLVVLAVALFAGGVVGFGWPALVDTNASDARWAVLFLAAAGAIFGLFFVFRGNVRRARFRRDGDSRLLAGLPRLGAPFAGRIVTAHDLQPRGDFRVTLRCDRSRRERPRKGSTRRQADRLFERIVAVPAPAKSTEGVPFAFEIPADGLRSGGHGEDEYGFHVAWSLEVRASMAGPDYVARFPIEVSGGRKAPAGKAFAGARKPLSPWQKVALPLLLALGSLLAGVGLYTTGMQVLLDHEGLPAGGRIVERERSAVRVVLDAGGATVRVPIGSNANRWTAGQAVRIVCRELGATPRGCQMDTGGERWIASIASLVLGLAMLGAAGWIWSRRTRVSRP